MQNSNGRRRRLAMGWLVGGLLLGLVCLIAGSAEAASDNVQTPEWQRSLPASNCPGSSEGTYCHRSSPVLVDLIGDGNLEIIVATNRGHVLAYKHDGTLLWDKDVARAFGMKANSQRIASSPAVADIDADGEPEIVVGTGTLFSSLCTQGGVIALEKNGAIKQGWPFLTKDYNVAPSGCRDTVFSTPALGDLDHDGDLEIVFGSFDMRIYALHHNGKLMAGFPVRSFHFTRFGWDNLKDRLADTVWSSPALADVNGDDYLDIIVGTDEGNFDSSWSGVSNWSCPYRGVSAEGYCGGSIYVLDRFGNILPGFPRYELEIIQSTPAAYDLDVDGRSEFFVGTGDFYHIASADHPRYGERLFGIDEKGNDLPGWGGGKKLGGLATSSPALGDIDGDGEAEVVIPARDQKLYAFELDGKPVRGFPMTPRLSDGRVLSSYFPGNGPVLADFTGDGKMEIFLNHSWETIIVDGSGHHVTASSEGDTHPVYKTGGSYWNSPAVGDLDSDGRLELVTQNSELSVWRLPNSSRRADWPMFKRDPARNSVIGPDVDFTPYSLYVVHKVGDSAQYTQLITLSSYLGTFKWKVETDNSTMVRLPQSTGSVDGQQSVKVVVSVSPEFRGKDRKVGSVTLTLSKDGEVVEKATIPVHVTAIPHMRQSFLPFTP
ncbi:MAG: FG-GAP repeat domain-containing protein [Candidatus Promineifilaceae bacterium]